MAISKKRSILKSTFFNLCQLKYVYDYETNGIRMRFDLIVHLNIISL